MLRTVFSRIKYLSLFAALSMVLLATACAPRSIGRRFSISTTSKVKVGHDQKRDVLHKLGQPIRRSVDGTGGEIFTYLWADGRGSGHKCIVVFNKNGIVSLVQVIP